MDEQLESSQLAIDSQIRHHATEIIRLEAFHIARIRDLKTQRNTFAKICRLPVEVLCSIFMQLKWALEAEHNRRYHLKWIVVSHICRHWREAALRFPQLWSSSISTAFGHQWIRLMCERSGGAPLSVNIDVALSRIRRDKFATVLGEILAKSSQFARLSVRLYDSDLQTHLPSLTAPAPLLETLSITKMNQSAFRVSPSLPAIPHDLFGNETPRLKHLHLSGCYLPLNSQLFSGLTSLKVEFCDSALDRPHPLQDVLSALSRMPDLVHLHVTDIRIAGSCQQTVSLPHLEKLRLAFSALNVSQLLCRLQLPASVKADITFREVEPSHRHSVLEAIHTFKSRHSDPDNPIRIKSCWIRYKGNNIYFVGTTSVSHESYLCDDTDPPGSSQLQLAILQTRHRSLSATDLTSALSLGHVEKLHLLGDIDPTQERSILLAFPSTRTLNVAKVQRENLIIECLKTDPAFSTPPSVSSDCARVTYFPLLERASFACIDNPTDFVDAWALRAANGSRLKVLDLRYCRGTTTRDEGLISKLREVVDEVLVSNHHYALPWETLPAAW